jgi:hypothetical protein
MHPITEKYVEENLAVLALPRTVDLSYVDVASFALANAHFRKQLTAVWIGWRHFLKSWLRNRGAYRQLVALKGTGRGRAALVLGNGPSQGYLTPEVLSEFKQRGDVFCVNRWFENEVLTVVPPNFVTLSDPFDSSISDSVQPVHAKMRDSLLRHDGVTIFCPMEWLSQFKQQFGDRCIGFNDWEIRSLRNFHPMFPRGYVSMTLFKALAMAMHIGYDSIYVLGMDNTYPRNMYCAPDRVVMNVRMHAGTDEYVECENTDVANLLFQLYMVFEDLNHFQRQAGGRIINLDPFSLTDAFPKATSIEEGQALLAAAPAEPRNTHLKQSSGK